MKHDGRFSEKVTLRGGTDVLIRSMQKEDGPALHGLFKALPAEDRLYLRDDVAADDFMDRYLERIAGGEMVPLVAVSEDKIVGNASLYRHQHGWTTHVGQIRMAVARPFQRKGLGTELARALVKLAMRQGVDKLVAEVADNQAGAKKAFGKLGFLPEAVLKGHVKDALGRKHDLCILSNDVSHIWEAMASLASEYEGTMEE
jgi:RimJ/RimL family protein N-acetyltransferase